MHKLRAHVTLSSNPHRARRRTTESSTATSPPRVCADPLCKPKISVRPTDQARTTSSIFALSASIGDGLVRIALHPKRTLNHWRSTETKLTKATGGSQTREAIRTTSSKPALVGVSSMSKPARAVRRPSRSPRPICGSRYQLPSFLITRHQHPSLNARVPEGAGLTHSRRSECPLVAIGVHHGR